MRSRLSGVITWSQLVSGAAANTGSVWRSSATFADRTLVACHGAHQAISKLGPPSPALDARDAQSFRVRGAALAFVHARGKMQNVNGVLKTVRVSNPTTTTTTSTIWLSTQALKCPGKRGISTDTGTLAFAPPIVCASVPVRVPKGVSRKATGSELGLRLKRSAEFLFIALTAPGGRGRQLACFDSGRRRTRGPGARSDQPPRLDHGPS